MSSTRGNGVSASKRSRIPPGRDWSHGGRDATRALPGVEGSVIAPRSSAVNTPSPSRASRGPSARRRRATLWPVFTRAPGGRHDDAAEHRRHRHRRPALGRARGDRASVHEDAAHRPAGSRGRAVHARLPHDAALLAEPRVHPDRAVREPARDHRQRRPRRGQPPAPHLPPRAPAAGLRDGARGQVAHGERRVGPGPATTTG